MCARAHAHMLYLYPVFPKMNRKFLVNYPTNSPQATVSNPCPRQEGEMEVASIAPDSLCQHGGACVCTCVVCVHVCAHVCACVCMCMCVGGRQEIKKLGPPKGQEMHRVTQSVSRGAGVCLYPLLSRCRGNSQRPLERSKNQGDRILATHLLARGDLPTPGCAGGHFQEASQDSHLQVSSHRRPLST